MSNYTFTFKKDDIYVEFTTTDKLAVERQFALWVTDASEAAKRKQTARPAMATAPVREPEIQPDVVPPKVEAPQEAGVVEPVVEAAFEPESPVVENNIDIHKPEEPVFEQSAPTESVAEENSQVFDKASDLLKTINAIQKPAEIQPQEPEKTVDFDKVLEAKIENPTFEPVQAKDENFLKVVESKNTSDRFHYLMITAYYLLEFEKKQRFSLKQINAKLMYNLSRVVDHSILSEAINQGFIEPVPDFTGTSEATEYKLTESGEDFYLHRIN